MPPAISASHVRTVDVRGRSYSLRALTKRESIEIDLALGAAYEGDEIKPKAAAALCCDVVSWVLVGWDRPETFPGGPAAVELLATPDLLALYREALDAKQLSETDRGN